MGKFTKILKRELRRLPRLVIVIVGLFIVLVASAVAFSLSRFTTKKL